MNVVLVGEESAGLQVLRALAESKHHLVAVLATQPGPEFSGFSLWNVARKMGFQTWPAEQVKTPELAERLRGGNVDILLNVHSLYRVNREVLAAPKLGAFNLHQGLLPRYAGINTVSWAIFRGENLHGVTVHKMDADLDTGPVVYQSCFPIEPDDTALSVSFKCVREGVTLMLRLLEAAEAGADNIPLIPQDPAKREFFGKEVPEQGRLSWSWPAQKVVNFVRACDYLPFSSPWGHPRSRKGAQEFALVKANRTGVVCDREAGEVGVAVDSGVYVACQDEWVLASKLRVDNKYVPAGAFLKSGDRLAG
jgi:methionyl-tRNA formyltransferase